MPLASDLRRLKKHAVLSKDLGMHLRLFLRSANERKKICECRVIIDLIELSLISLRGNEGSEKNLTVNELTNNSA